MTDDEQKVAVLSGEVVGFAESSVESDAFADALAAADYPP